MMINTKFKGAVYESAQPITTIHPPENPTISGMPAWVALDKYKNCKVAIDSCAPFDITFPEMKKYVFWNLNKSHVFHSLKVLFLL